MQRLGQESTLPFLFSWILFLYWQSVSVSELKNCIVLQRLGRIRCKFDVQCLWMLAPRWKTSSAPTQISGKRSHHLLQLVSMKTRHLTILLLVTTVGLWLVGRNSSSVPPPKEQVYLSTFLPHAGGCGWYRTRLPDGGNELIERFHVDCHGIALSWHPEFSQAVVWIGGDMDLMAWHVDIADKESARLPAIEGDVKRFFFTEQGELIATVIRPTATEIPVEDTLALVGNVWKQKSHMTSHAQAASDLQADTWQVVEDHLLHSQLDRLLAVSLQRPKRKWYQHKEKNGGAFMLLAYASRDDIPDRMPAILRWEHQGKVQPLPHLDFSLLDAVRLTRQSDYLLIVEADSGMSPQVYNWKNGKQIFASKPAHLVMFWPTP